VALSPGILHLPTTLVSGTSIHGWANVDVSSFNATGAYTVSLYLSPTQTFDSTTAVPFAGSVQRKLPFNRTIQIRVPVTAAPEVSAGDYFVVANLAGVDNNLQSSTYFSSVSVQTPVPSFSVTLPRLASLSNTVRHRQETRTLDKARTLGVFLAQLYYFSFHQTAPFETITLQNTGNITLVGPAAISLTADPQNVVAGQADSRIAIKPGQIIRLAIPYKLPSGSNAVQYQTGDKYITASVTLAGITQTVDGLV
jgi:hypothetical protein